MKARDAIRWAAVGLLLASGGCARRAVTRAGGPGQLLHGGTVHRADDRPAEALDYIEYRAQPELGQISVFTGVLNGPKTIGRVERSADALAEHGILICAGDAPRLLHRTDDLAGRRFETLVLAQPPDPDEPDAGWRRRLLVTVDGRLKVDCSLGGAGPDATVFVSGIQLFPEDNTLAFTALDPEGYELSIPDDVASLDDETVITDDTFESPSEDEADPAKPAPVRV